MKVPVAAFAALLITGCDQRQPQLTEAELEEIREGNPGMTDACLAKLRWDGLAAFPTSAADGCYRMDKPLRWRGLYRFEFEQSLFCPAPARECRDSLSGAMWLSATEDGPWWPNVKTDQGSLYAVDFIGRRTAVRGNHGHQSQYPYEVVVDRMISMNRIEAPAK